MLKSVQSWHKVFLFGQIFTLWWRKKNSFVKLYKKCFWGICLQKSPFFRKYGQKSPFFSGNTVKVATFGCWGRQNKAAFSKSSTFRPDLLAKFCSLLFVNGRQSTYLTKLRTRGVSITLWPCHLHENVS